MKTHFQLAVAAMLGVFAMAITASFLLTSLVGQDSKNEKLAFTLQLRRGMAAFIEFRSETLADQIAKRIEKESQLPPDSAVPLTQSKFLAIGLMDEDLSGSGGWTPGWIRSASTQMDSNWLKGLIPSLPLERVKGDELTWTRVAAPDGQIYFMLLAALQVNSQSTQQKKLSFGILPTGIFSDVNLVSKGEKESLFVIDGQGTAYSFPDQQYVGGKITNHPIIAALMKGQATESSGRYNDVKDGVIVGGYDHINKTNLFAVASTPQSSNNETFFRFLVEVGLVAVAITLILAIAVFYLSSREQQKIQILQHQLTHNVGARKVTPLVVDSGDERLREFARGVANFLYEPLSVLVGLVQMAESQIVEGSVKGVFNKITAEARKIRDFTEALHRKFGKAGPKTEIISLNPIVSQVIDIFRNEMSKQKILFEENVKAEISVKANYESLKESLKILFQYVIYFVGKGNGQKKVILNMEKVGGLIQVSLEGHGVELKAEERRKIFLPFETTLPGSKNMGLDLALAQNYIQSLHGEIIVESLGLGGLRLISQIPISEVLNPLSAEQQAQRVLPPPPKENLDVEVTQKLSLEPNAGATGPRSKLRFDF